MIQHFHHRLLRRLAGHHGFEKLAVALMHPWRPRVGLPRYRAPGSAPPGKGHQDWSDAPIIATSRFRSGSTLLWQAFDRLDGVTAFYEPFNERRWFDPSVRGEGVDASHRGTSDYSKNYDGLEGLSQWYDVNWTTRHLVMDVKHKDSGIINYIKYIISKSIGRPVLQFNRVDFRLAFLRRAFPEAVLVHLMRDCRDVWRSSLKGAENDPAWRLADFEPHAHFYLMVWYRDLAVTFPNLLQDGAKVHPYLVHVLIERLSELFAYEHADIFVRYEDLCSAFLLTMDRLLHQLGWQGAAGPVADWSSLDQATSDALTTLISPRSAPYDHAKDADFYAEQEAAAEAILKPWLPAAQA